MKIALVHDYLAQNGGAERVLKAFHEMWPEAPIFVLFHDSEKITDFNPENIRESFLARFPFVKKNFQWYLPLMPGATERHDLSGFDVVISSTSAFAKGIITSPSTLHISYCHTPARYLWSDSRTYISDLPYNPLVKMALPRLISQLRIWDKMSADRVDYFIANSRTVQYRIHKYYRRESEVIHPPVDLAQFSISQTQGDYFIAGGRLVPYKNFDLLVKAFNRFGKPLKIFGTGPEFKRLSRIAKSNIQFLGHVTEEQKSNLLRESLAFVNPQIEDFGITPLEAMASGRPVIAFAGGGATETVIPNETGIFFNEQNWESLYEALRKFDADAWDKEKIRDHASKFKSENFKLQMSEYVNSRLEEFKKGLRQPTLLR